MIGPVSQSSYKVLGFIFGEYSGGWFLGFS